MASKLQMRMRALLGAFVVLLSACGGTSPGDDLAAPAPGEVIATTISMSSILVRWSAPDEAEFSSYRLQRRENLEGEFVDVGPSIAATTATADGLRYLDVGLAPETFYGYRVIGVDQLGRESPASTVAGARTVPAPAIDLELQLQSSLTDDDGLRVRAEGPDTLEVPLAAPTSASAPARVRLGPLSAGTYRVSVSGVAGNCRTDPSTFDVTLTDEGTETVVRQVAALICRDPSRGDVVAELSVRGGSSAQPFRVELSTTDAAVPDNERIVESPLPAAGGSTVFRDLRPVTYEAQLTGIVLPCRSVGEAVTSVTPTALGSDTVRFIVDCEVPPAPPTTPYVFRYGIPSGTFAPGATIVLPISVDLSGGPPTTLSGSQVLIEYDPAVVRPDSTQSRTGWSCVSNVLSPGRFTFLASSSQVPPPAPLLCNFFLTVVGAPGTSTTTRTSAVAMSDVDGNVIANELFSGAEFRVQVGAGGGSGGGGGSNQSPTAVIAGATPLAATAGVPLTVSGASSSDPDGTIAGYAWSFPGGSPTSGTGASSTVTYAAAGTYSITLTVTDNGGATASATRQVTVAAGGGSANQPPVAVIAGGSPLLATVGAPLGVSASGSSDPDGSIASYQWTFSGGAPASASGASASVTYASAGNYTVVLVVTDDRGATATATRAVTVSGGSPGTPGGPFTWTSSFGALNAADSTVALTVTYDLNSDPSALLESFRIDSLAWNPTQLQLRSINWGFGIGQTFTNQSFVSQGRLVNSGGTFGSAGRGGFLTMLTIRFRVLPTATRGTTASVRTSLGSVLAAAAAGGANYLSRTTIVDGGFTIP